MILAISTQLAVSVWVEKMRLTGGSPPMASICAASGRA